MTTTTRWLTSARRTLLAMTIALSAVMVLGTSSAQGDFDHLDLELVAEGLTAPGG